MKKMISGLCAFSMAAIALSGCGVSLNTASPALSGSVTELSASATTVIKKSFKEIHKAIFAKIDGNADKQIDEYEAGQYIRLQDFAKMDKNKDGKISYKIFMDYATDFGFFGGQDNADRYLKRMRSDLQSAFKMLDRDRSWLLEEKELSKTAIKKLGLGFAYDNLHIKLSIKEFSADEIKAADKTGDGNLSQAEFEDLYIEKVKALISPSNPNPPDPAPVDPAPAPVEPASGSVTPAV
ncbi:MAG: EF-hand domain-containing protein [Bacteroidota bacterium]